MLNYLMDLLFVLAVVVAAILVGRRCLAEAVLIFLAVTLSCLIAIGLFEPAANYCAQELFFENDIFLTKFFWSFFAIGIFCISMYLLVVGFYRALIVAPDFSRSVDRTGAIFFGIVTGYVFAAFLLTVCHALPIPRDAWGLLPPEAHRRAGPVMSLAPDYQFLSFAEYVFGPRSPVTGQPWSIGGPIATLEVGSKSRWSSFPIRFAVWRELLFYVDDPTTDEEQPAGELGESDATDLDEEDPDNNATEFISPGENAPANEIAPKGENVANEKTPSNIVTPASVDDAIKPAADNATAPASIEDSGSSKDATLEANVDGQGAEAPDKQP